jgi:hypothetical protein
MVDAASKIKSRMHVKVYSTVPGLLSHLWLRAQLQEAAGKGSCRLEVLQLEEQVQGCPQRQHLKNSNKSLNLILRMT